MFTLLAIIATTQAYAGPSDDAVVLLSRFPAGAVPAVPAVISAIETLGATGKHEHTALLEALQRDEVDGVAHAAKHALRSIAPPTVTQKAAAPKVDSVIKEDAHAPTVADAR